MYETIDKLGYKLQNLIICEDEKGYEIAKQYLEKKYAGDYVDFIESEGQTFLDGSPIGKIKE